MMESRFRKLITGKNVIYITVKNAEYIRTRQIEKILRESAGSFEIYPSEKNNPLSRMCDLKRRIRGISFEKYDVVIAGFLPQLIWGSIEKKVASKKKALLKKKLSLNKAIGNYVNHSDGPKIVAEMFLSFYDTVVLDRKLVWKHGILSALCRMIDRKVILGADLVLTDTKADADYFTKEFGGDRQKLEVLYLEAEIRDIDNAYYAEENNPAVPVHNSECAGGSPRTILYFGTGLSLQGTDVVARAYQILHKQDEDYGRIASDEHSECGGNSEHSDNEFLKLIYIGGTDHMTKSQRSFIQSSAVEYHKWLSETELLSKIGEADICLAGHFNASIDKADRTIPGKAFIYEALHKKMILGDTRANHELFVQDREHIFVDRGNAEALAKCIRKSLV